MCLQCCVRLGLTIDGAGHTDVRKESTLLVVYQNTIPEIRSDLIRATRRALRSGWSRHEEMESREERYRRRLRRGDLENNDYCRPYKWLVDFRKLNWTWIVAPQKFEAGYCAGRCPSDDTDLERVNLTNHAFMRMVHRAWTFNMDGGRLPPPSCVSVRYSQMSILYRTDQNSFELRHLNEMVSTACGCL